MRLHRTAVISLVLVAAGCGRKPANDTEAVQGIVRNFLNDFENKRLNRAMAVWDPAADLFITRREELYRLFVANRIRVAKITLKTEFYGALKDRARVHVTGIVEVKDVLNGRPADGYDGSRRLFELVNKSGSWKIASFGPAEAELAGVLSAERDAGRRIQQMRTFRNQLNVNVVGVLDKDAADAGGAGHPEEAIRLANLAMEAASVSGQTRAVAWADTRKAEILRNQSAADARPLAEEGLRLFDATGDQHAEAVAQCILASILAKENEYKDASDDLQSALAIANRTSDRYVEGLALNNLGEVARLHPDEHRPDEALNYFLGSLTVDRMLADKPGESADLLNVANIYQERNENQKALSNYRQAVAIDEYLQDKRALGIDWSDVGSLLDAMGRYPEALDADEKSLPFERETRNREGEADSLNNIGIILIETGKLSDALEKFEESRGVALAIPDAEATAELQARALGNSGNALQLQGNYGGALVAFQKSIEFEQRAGNQVGEAISRGSIGELYSNTAKYSEALDSFANTIPLFVKLHRKLEEETSIDNMAAVFMAMGEQAMATNDSETAGRRFQQAEYGYRTSLAMKGDDLPGEVITLSGLAQLYQKQNRFPESIVNARRAAEVAEGNRNPMGQAEAALILADSLRMAGNASEAEKNYRLALRLSLSLGAEDKVALAYEGLGSMDLRRKDWRRAEADCIGAITAVELAGAAAGDPDMRAGFFGLHQKPYSCLVDSLMQRNRDSEALQASERGRARALIEMLDRGNVDVRQALNTEDSRRMKALDTRVAEIQIQARQAPSPVLIGQLRNARRAREEFRRIADAKTPDIAARRGDIPPFDLAALKPYLRDAHYALIEYSIAENGSWIFLIRGPSRENAAPELSVIPLQVGPDDLDRNARGLWERLRQPGAKERTGGREDLPEASKLYRYLVAPVADKLRDVTVLGVVPDGNLWLVPFSALRDPAGKYLGESKAIFYAPSFTALGIMDRTAEKRVTEMKSRLNAGEMPVLLAGNPILVPKRCVPGIGCFEELPETGDEMKSMNRLLGGHAKILDRKDATEANVRVEASGKSVIYLGAHGFFDPANPMHSGIILSNDDNRPEDGIWEAREIAQQTLNADFVIVSACETARGDVAGGEGLMGMSWAFFVAKVPTAMLTGWKLNNKVASPFMERFFSEWKIGDTSSPVAKVLALQRTQRAMLSTAYADPYYWATYMLLGSPR